MSNKSDGIKYIEIKNITELNKSFTIKENKAFL